MSRLKWITALLLACLLGSQADNLARPGKPLHDPADWRAKAFTDSLAELASLPRRRR